MADRTKLTPAGTPRGRRPEAPVFDTTQLTELTEVLEATKAIEAAKGPPPQPSLFERLRGWVRAHFAAKPEPKPERPTLRYVPEEVVVEEDGEQIDADTLAAVRAALATMEADSEPSAA